MWPFCTLAVAGLTSVLVACQQAPATTSTDADVEAINAVREGEPPAWAGKDVDALVALFAEDARVTCLTSSGPHLPLWTSVEDPCGPSVG